jgi:hypothetical protein
MFRTIGIAIICLIIFGRCAQQVAPTGGKKDTLAPNLIESIPLNKTLNFKGNKIELYFDEYVVLNNIMQKLIITPSIENPYTSKQNGTSVSINFKNKFKDSTTYTLNFGDGIIDFAERNPAKNLKLVFSTGSTLDSGRVYGTVKDIQTNKAVADALVGLYEVSDTLDVAKQKPIYFSRTDTSGIFVIENTPIESYKLIAIDDKNRNMLYNTKDERIGFLTPPVNTSSDSSHYQLTMFHSDVTPLKIQRTIPKVNNYTVVLNRAIERVDVDFVSNDSLPYIFENPTQLKFFNIQPHSDTTVVILSLTDSLGTLVKLPDSKITFLAPRGKERQKDPFTVTSDPPSGQPISDNVHYQFTFNKPVKALDESKIKLHSDSTQQDSLTKIPWSWNKTLNILTIDTKFSAKDTVKWDLPKGSVISIEGDTLPHTVIKHKMTNTEDYGILHGNVTGTDSTSSFIVQLIDEQHKIFGSVFTTPFTFTNIPQGRYSLRLIVDSNRNKKWDSGDIYNGRQPEEIIYVPEKILIKSNFELSDQNIHIH